MSGEELLLESKCLLQIFGSIYIIESTILVLGITRKLVKKNLCFLCGFSHIKYKANFVVLTGNIPVRDT